MKKQAISYILEWASINAELYNATLSTFDDYLEMTYYSGDIKVRGVTHIEELDGVFTDKFLLIAEKNIDGKRTTVSLRYDYDCFSDATSTAEILYKFPSIAAGAIDRYRKIEKHYQQNKNILGTTKP